MTTQRKITLTHARRLVLYKQRLAGPRPTADRAGLLDVVRSIGCLQLDPISAVARNHLLVLWSRLGQYDKAELDALLWEERKLFEYWAHEASIVLTEDFPVYEQPMYAFANGASPWSKRVHAWLAENSEFYDEILNSIKVRGPVQSKELDGTPSSAWSSSGWTNDRNVTRMLHYLWMMGRVMVAGRKNGQRLWDLSERVLPDWTPHAQLDARECTHLACQRSLKMLGVGTAKHIEANYTRRRYPHLAEVLRELEAEGSVQQVEVGEDAEKLPGTWYIHSDDVPLLERIEGGEWQPRTTLLSPFDNLIADRTRTERLFNYRFRIEIYVPRHLREYGYYVLSILHGDRIIGRVDPTYNRKARRLDINAVYAEPDTPQDTETGEVISNAVKELAAFLGAEQIVYGEQVPPAWRDALVGEGSG